MNSTKQGTFPDSDALLDWLHAKLRRKADEVDFLRARVFPHPVQPWAPSRMSTAPPSAKQVVKVAIFDKQHSTCPFYVTQGFRLVGDRTLFAGLQPDCSSFPTGKRLRLCLCIAHNQSDTPIIDEIKTRIILTDPGEFQLIHELEPDIAARWNESSTHWQTEPASIPFGLALRPIGDDF
jgi:hypothetical protein